MNIRDYKYEVILLGILIVEIALCVIAMIWLPQLWKTMVSYAYPVMAGGLLIGILVPILLAVYSMITDDRHVTIIDKMINLCYIVLIYTVVYFAIALIYAKRSLT